MPEKKARLVRTYWVLFWLANIGLLFYVWFDGRWSAVERGGGAALIAVGALCGLIGAYLLITQLVLISGLPPIERAFGLDKLANKHRFNGRAGYLFIMAHVSLIVIGYSELTGRGLFSQYLQLKDGLPYVLLASIAIFLLNVVVFSSIYFVRNKIRYEWWRAIHFLVYAVIVLAFWHQISNGHEFVGNDLVRYYWWVLYWGALAAVIYMRYIHPRLLAGKFQWRVDHVEPESKGVTSVYVSGKGLERFAYQAGQFNLWKFSQRGLRWQKHPFTISSSPGDSRLRLSAKAIGNYSSALAGIKPGTKVLINGPYGRFSMALSGGRPRLFIAGGIGITPIRSMLGQEVKKGDVLLYGARTMDDLVFKKEFDGLAPKGLTTNYVLSDQKGLRGNIFSGYLEKELISQLVPDAAERDVWLCGPPAMMDKVEKSLRELGVPKRQIHTERFRL